MEESLIIKYKGKDGKEADFVDYIECVKKNYSPKWNDCAKRVHEIRKIHNSVHIKKWLSRSETIDEKVCQDIINKLERIIDSGNELMK
ncbi:MAG: hypothetical protein ACOCNC_10880 [Acetivibrio ethanolgignens]